MYFIGIMFAIKNHDKTKCEKRNSDGKTSQSKLKPHIQFFLRHETGDNKDNKGQKPFIYIFQIIGNKPEPRDFGIITHVSILADRRFNN